MSKLSKQPIYYISVMDDLGITAMYSLDNMFNYQFKSLQEMRKEKLKKLQK